MRLLVGALLFGLSQGGSENATKPLAESQASIDARLHLVDVCPEVTTKCAVPKTPVAEIPDLAAALDCMLKVNISAVEPGPCYDALKTFQRQVGANAAAQAPFPFPPRTSTPFPVNVQRVNSPQVVFIRGAAQQSPSQVSPASRSPMMGFSIARPSVSSPMMRPSMGSQSPMGMSQSPMGMRPSMGSQFPMMGLRSSTGSQFPMRPSMGSMRPPMMGVAMGMRAPFMRGGDEDDDDSFMGRPSRYGAGPRKPFWMDEEDDDDDRISWRDMPRRPPMGMRPPFMMRGDSRPSFMSGDSRSPFTGRFSGPRKPFWMDEDDDDDEDRQPFWMSRRDSRPPMGRSPFHGPGPQKPFWMNDRDDDRMSRWRDDDDEDRQPFWMSRGRDTTTQPRWRDEDDDEDRAPFWMSRGRDSSRPPTGRSSYGAGPQKPFWMDRAGDRMSRWRGDEDDDEDEKPSWQSFKKPSWGSKDKWSKHGSYESKSWKSSRSSRKYDSDHDNQYKFAYKPSFHMSLRGSPDMRPPMPPMPFSRGAPSSMQGSMSRGMPSQGQKSHRAPQRSQSSGSPSMLMMMLPQLMGGNSAQNPMSNIMKVMLQSKLLAARNNNDADYDYDTDDYDSDANYDYDYDYDYDDSSSGSSSSSLLISSLLQKIGGQSAPHVTITEVPVAPKPSGEKRPPVEVTQQTPAVEVRDPKKAPVKEAPASEQVSYRNLP